MQKVGFFAMHDFYFIYRSIGVLQLDDCTQSN